jgi:cob(I)alamin adenosyltransferase
VIVATKAVARTNLRRAERLVYPDDESSCVSQ